MKRFLSFILAILTCSCFVIPANAAEVNVEDRVNRSVYAAAIPMEVSAAEAVLAKPCVLAEESIENVGEYVVVNRLYVPAVILESAQTAGAVSAVTWYKRGQSAWTYKVQLAGWFEYDGTEAHCVEASVEVVDASYDDVSHSVKYSYLSGESAAANAHVTITEENLKSTLMVTCNKNGKVGYKSVSVEF